MLAPFFSVRRLSILAQLSLQTICAIMDKCKTRKHKLDFFETSLEVDATEGGLQMTDIFEKDLTLNCAFVVLQSISTNFKSIF